MTTAQVVHSAGRRFIVSPVPESRLREQFFGGTSSNTSFGDEPGERTFILCRIKLSPLFGFNCKMFDTA